MLNQKSVIPMRTAKIGYIVTSLVLCAAGIILICFPKLSASAIAVTMGVLMIAFGIIKLIGYFSKDLYRLAFQYDLAFGLLLITLGIIILLKPSNVIGFICVVLGISTLADSLFKIQMSFDAKSFGLNKWWLILLIAVLTAVIGLALIIHPLKSSSVLIVLIGISLLAEGILSFITVLTAVKIIKHQKIDNFDLYS